jgi:hypothetical protein
MNQGQNEKLSSVYSYSYLFSSGCVNWCAACRVPRVSEQPPPGVEL